MIEFSKENKKIILSHSKIHQDAAYNEKNKEAKAGQKKEKDTKKAVKKLKDNLEKTTLGDIESLANLKADMMAAEEKSRAPKTVASKEELPFDEPQAEEGETDEPQAE